MPHNISLLQLNEFSRQKLQVQVHQINKFQSNRSNMIFKGTWLRVRYLMPNKVCNYSRKKWVRLEWVEKNLQEIMQICRKPSMYPNLWKKFNLKIWRASKIMSHLAQNTRITTKEIMNRLVIKYLPKKLSNKKPLRKDPILKNKPIKM